MRIYKGRGQRFAAVPNETVDDSDLNMTELGLLTQLLRNRDGWQDDIESMARRRGPGRKALTAAMQTLVRLGYVVKVKHQGGSGKWETSLFAFDLPATDDEVADILSDFQQCRTVRVEPQRFDPKREAPTDPIGLVGGDQGKQGVSKTKPQVAPTDPIGAVGIATAGEVSAHKKTVPKTVPNHPPTPHGETDPNGPAEHEGGGGSWDETEITPVSSLPASGNSAPGEGKANEDGHAQAAREDVLEQLPHNPWRLSRRQIDKLVPLAAAALSDSEYPWEADALYEHLNQLPPKGMRSGYGVLRNRLGEDLPLPEPKAPVLDTTPCKLHSDQYGRNCPTCRAELKVSFGSNVDWTGFATPADAWTAWTEETTHAA